MGDYNIPDFEILLKTVEILKLQFIIKLTNSIIVIDLSQKYDLHKVVEHQSRDDISIDRLEVSCPGNRFNECTKWEKFHISCYVSRAFQLLCDKILYGMGWASSSEIEEIREIVEKKFKVRMVSVIDVINTSRDNIEVCKRYHSANRKKQCLECMWHAMMEKYFKKRLEIELLFQNYWLGGLYKRPMKGYSKNMTTIFKAVKD